jgi:hypothetical protein
MHLNQKLTGFLLLAGLFTTLALNPATVEAGLFGKKKPKMNSADPVQTYQPPPPEAQETNCEPIRQKILTMNRRPFIAKLLSRPRVVMLKNDHRECILGIKQQQIEYLRHVDNPQAPSLPPLNVDEVETK